jgi:hypothetical protein
MMSSAARSPRCPICGKPTAAAHRPFCSERCRAIDLNRWLSGAYVIPANEETAEKADVDGRDTADERN